MYLHTLPPMGVRIHIGELDAILSDIGVSSVHGDLRGSIGHWAVVAVLSLGHHAMAGHTIFHVSRPPSLAFALINRKMLRIDARTIFQPKQILT